MGHKVQRKIERGNGQHRSHREALHQSQAALIALGQVQGEAFAADPGRLFGGGLESECSTVHLSARQAHGLAGLSDNQLGEAFFLFEEGGGHVFEDFATLPAGERASAAQTGHGVIHGLARVGPGGDGDPANQALVPG